VRLGPALADDARIIGLTVLIAELLDYFLSLVEGYSQISVQAVRNGQQQGD
jgi:hypothetical protein